MMPRYTHVIIGGPRLEENNIIYRRRKLLEFLARHDSTKVVYWIYFNPVAKNKMGSLLFPALPEMYCNPRYKKIVQIEISDFKFLISYIGILQNRIGKRIIKITGNNDNTILWYTLQRFSKLSSLKNWWNTVYDCTDNWTNNDQNGILKYIYDFITHSSEKRIIKNTNIHFSSSPYLKNKVENISRKVCRLIEHGFDPSQYESLHKIKKITNNKIKNICYLGSVQYNKIDIDLIHSICKANREWKIFIIGPADAKVKSSDLYRFQKNFQNVVIEDGIRPCDVPRKLLEMDLGILPYKNTQFTKGIFPLKFFEYMAAGLPIVGCNLHSLKKFDELGVYYNSTDKTEDFLRVCKKALESTVPVDIYKNVLNSVSWDYKFEEMYSTVIKYDKSYI